MTTFSRLRYPPSFTGGGRSCFKAETTINDMPLPQHAQPPPLASICPTTPPRGVVMHVEARRVVGHVKGADGTGRDRMGLDGKGTKTAQYRAPGRPRSSRRHGSIANSIFYRLEASMSDSTIKHKNVRIPSHRASQKLSTARFDSKFYALSHGGVVDFQP